MHNPPLPERIMTTATLFNTQWQTKDLLKHFGLALLIALSWLWSPTRAVWDTADLSFFHAMNQPIAHHPQLALFWAILNMRPVDALVGILLFSLLLRGDWAVPAKHVRTACIGLVILLIWMVVIRIGFVKLLNALDWSRASPSEYLPEAIKLTTLFPGWDEKYHLKDGSPISFPGDHASVLILWGMLLSRFVTGYKRTLIWTLAALLSLPRLAAGAHWVSDDLLGGLIIALISYATAIYTPLLASLSLWTEKHTRPLMRLFKKLPVIGKMSVFTGL